MWPPHLSSWPLPQPPGPGPVRVGSELVNPSAVPDCPPWSSAPGSHTCRALSQEEQRILPDGTCGLWFWLALAFFCCLMGPTWLAGLFYRSHLPISVPSADLQPSLPLTGTHRVLSLPVPGSFAIRSISGSREDIFFPVGTRRRREQLLWDCQLLCPCHTAEELSL